jgi:hypothetical protein
MSVLDIALWDVLGKAAKLPLHRLWGHYRRATAGLWQRLLSRGSGGDGMIAKALHYKERGYKAIKMQVAHTADLATDLDNVARMREAVGPDIDIMIVTSIWAGPPMSRSRWDENSRLQYLLAGRARRARRLCRYLPLPKRSICALSAARTHFTRFDLKPFFRKSAAADPATHPSARRIDRVAQDRHRRRYLEHDDRAHLFPELNVQLLASIPNGL